MLDEFTRHEALDRAGILVDLLVTMLGDNEAVQGDDAARAAFDAAHEALAALYQACGVVSFGEEYERVVRE